MNVIRLALTLLALVTPHAANAANGADGFAWFRGEWSCTVRAKAPPHAIVSRSHWAFAAADAGGWYRLTYGLGAEVGGNAVVGYLPIEHSWIYNDFHADGSYARERSPRPAGGTWTWSGRYYPPHGAAPIDGKVEWHIRGAKAFDMLFYPANATAQSAPSGMQSCLRV